MELQKAIMIPRRLRIIYLKFNSNSNYILQWKNKNIFPFAYWPKTFLY